MISHVGEVGAMRVYAFMDFDHPAVAWAIMRGALVSVAAGPERSPGFISHMMAGMIYWQNNARLYNEAIVERVRARNYPGQVSRLRGVYAFSDPLLARRMIGAIGWPEYFRPENLVELELYARGNLTCVDADWITHAPRLPSGRLDLDDLDWIDSYWSGVPRSGAPVWETITEGVSVVLDRAARERAYKTVQKLFPDCWIMIEMARLASEVGSDGGLNSPFLLRESDHTISLRYVLREAEFRDPSVIALMRAHPDAPRLVDRGRATEQIVLPDFRPWWKAIALSVREVGPLGDSILAVHHQADAPCSENPSETL